MAEILRASIAVFLKYAAKFIRSHALIKLSKVGLSGKKVGGMCKISVLVLKEFNNIHITGKTAAKAPINNNMYFATSHHFILWRLFTAKLLDVSLSVNLNTSS